MRCLVLGGTRFFGKRLVQKLIDKKYDVTVASRGKTEDPFGSKVSRITVDRADPEALRGALKAQSWDVVYDQIGFNSNDAEGLINALDGRSGRLIFTSTLSVCDLGANLKEETFDPLSAVIRFGRPDEFTYQEGKRLAEAYYLQKANLPVTCVRIPIVLGLDDYTKRLHLHIERVKAQQPIFFPSLSSKMSFISSSDAADFLSWLGERDVLGAIHASSPEAISMGDLMKEIEQAVGKKAVYADKEGKETHSPFGVPSDWYMNTSKANELGYHFSSLNAWLPNLIKDIAR